MKHYTSEELVEAANANVNQPLRNFGWFCIGLGSTILIIQFLKFLFSA